MAFLADLLDQVDGPFQLGAREVDREEHNLEAVLVREGGGLDRGLDRLFHRPAVGEVDHVLAGGDFHDDAVDAGVDGALHVFLHAAGEGDQFSNSFDSA